MRGKEGAGGQGRLVRGLRAGVLFPLEVGGQGPAAPNRPKGRGVAGLFPSWRVRVPGTSVLPAFSPRAQTWAPLARTRTRTGPNLPGDAVYLPTAAARRRGRGGGARGGRAGSAPPGGPPFSPSPPPLSPLSLSLPLSLPLSPAGGGAAAPARSGPSAATQRPVSMAAALAAAQRRSRHGRHRASAADEQVREWGTGPAGRPRQWGLRRQRRSALACGARDAGTRAAAAPQRETRASAAGRASGRPGPGRSRLALFQVAGEARGAEGSGPGPAEGPQPGAAPSPAARVPPEPLGPLLGPDPPSLLMPAAPPATGIRAQGGDRPCCTRAPGPRPPSLGSWGGRAPAFPRELGPRSGLGRPQTPWGLVRRA